MSRRFLPSALAAPLRAFAADRRGNVALIFALATIPMVGAVATAVDYSRANAARTAMQAALDSTALMVSKEALDLKSTQVDKKATKYFKAMFDRTDVKNLDLVFDLKINGPGDFTVFATAKGKIDTSFAKIFGISQLDLATNAQVRWGYKALELALALDNTGSMASKNKMTELKAAAKNLLATLKKNSKTTDDIKVSIIPFNTVVNIGTEYKDKPWIDYVGGITSATWAGCVADRDQPNDARDTTPTAAAKTKFPTATCLGTLTTAMPLTSDWTVLDAKIDAMTPTGTTNVTIGLEWAWHSLSNNEPWTTASLPRPDVEKVIILLTDGLNTANRFTTVSSQIDARTAEACTNVKAANIKLFTVRVIEGNATLLRDCATSPAMFYDVSSASQLNDVFAAIAASLSGIRLAK
jgi:Flp pilus assembly protein TadG